MSLRSIRLRRGFTLLELIVVIAILATIGGGLLVAYDGLEDKAGKGQATFNIAGLDKSIRTFATVTGNHPNNLDALMFSSAGNGTDSVPLDIMPSNFADKFGPHTLTAEGVAALNEAGITSLRFVSAGYPNDNSAEPAIPNRIFDEPSRGNGVGLALTTGVIVACVESGGVVDDFNAATTTTDSSRLRDMAGLDATLGHVVVAMGIGNNSTLVVGDGGGAGLAEAPYYTNVPKNDYGRFFAIYHLGSQQVAAGPVAYFSKAKFLGVIDTKGDWYDEEYSEFTGQKP